MCPEFTTSNPGPFGDTSDCNQEFIDKHRGECRVLGADVLVLYIHGALENKVGFDIPIWLSGTINVAWRVQDCVVYSVSGEEKYDAKLVLSGRRGYIVLPEEVEEALEK